MAALSAAYLSYYINESVFHTSGVVAVSVTGLVTNAFGRSLINDHKLMGTYLGLMEHMLCTILFTLGGVMWGVDASRELLLLDGNCYCIQYFSYSRKIEPHLTFPLPFLQTTKEKINQIF